MARLQKTERDALRKFASAPRIEQPQHKPVPFADYLNSISNLPESLRPSKPVRFVGKHWKL